MSVTGWVLLALAAWILMGGWIEVGNNDGYDEPEGRGP
jgi:hypothetical protein